MENKFSAWLLDELKKRDWNQSDLAQRSGVSQGAISKVLQGQRNPGLEFCSGVAKAFRVPVEKVLILAGFLPARDHEVQEIEELKFLFNALSDESKKDLLIYARFLLSEDEKRA